MEKRIDPTVVFEDNNILNLARSNWPKKGDIYHYNGVKLILVVETHPMYIKGVEPTVTQTNPKSWGVTCTARNMEGEIIKGYTLQISALQELPLNYLGNTIDIENTEE